MTGEVIKSFLVGLGFGVDESSLNKFNKAIASATLKITALYTATDAAAAGIGYGITKVSEGFEQMGYEYRLIVPAVNKALVLRRELLKAYSAAGININKVIQNSVKLNFSLAKTRFAFKAIYDSVASRFFPLIIKQSELFRAKLYANLPRIQEVLERFITFIFKAFDATLQLGSRLGSILGRIYDFFVALDKATNGWSTAVLAIVAAWKALNLTFLATPLGLLFTLATTLLALYDDFKTFQEGGKSLIDWGSDTTRTILGLVTALGAVAAAVYAVSAALKAWAAVQAVINFLLVANPIGIFIVAIGILIAALTALYIKLAGVKNFFSGIGGKVIEFFGGVNAAANVADNLQNNPTSNAPINPLGSGAKSSQTNQNVNQQTSINVIGTADPHGTASAIAGQQARVNYDHVNNLKGSVR